MTTQPQSTESLSSQVGRSWLKKTQPLNDGWTSSSESKDVELRSRTPEIKTVEVSLPDVAVAGDSGFDLSQAIHPTIVAKLLAGEPIQQEASNDISETPAQWGDKSADKPSTRNSPAELPKPAKKESLNDSIDSLCDSILKRFPLGDPSVLLVVGAEPNHHIDEACARIADRLAERDVGRILLVDSDLKEQALTQASGLADSKGISDVTNLGFEWNSLVYEGDTKRLDFLPGGTHEMYRHPEEKARMRAAVTEMKQNYQFVLVSAGDAHGSSAKIWNDICDGSYLLVSMKNSNETYAQSAVAELRSSGSRLLGCVVTDVD